MTPAKRKKEVDKSVAVQEAEPVGVPVVEPVEPDLPSPETEIESVPEVPVRKPLGTKEIIPFRWKLIGRAGDAIVTLFKAVEREDVEAQQERTRKEGYYQDLQILEANAKVEQPKPKPIKKFPAPVSKSTPRSAEKGRKLRSSAGAAAARPGRSKPKGSTARSTPKVATKRSASSPAKKSRSGKKK